MGGRFVLARSVLLFFSTCMLKFLHHFQTFFHRLHRIFDEALLLMSTMATRLVFVPSFMACWHTCSQISLNTCSAHKLRTNHSQAGTMLRAYSCHSAYNSCRKSHILDTWILPTVVQGTSMSPLWFLPNRYLVEYSISITKILNVNAGILEHA